MTNKLSIRLEFALTPLRPSGQPSPSAPPAHQPSADSDGKHHHPLHRLIPSTLLFTQEKNDSVCYRVNSQWGRNTFWSTSFRVNFAWTAKMAKMMSDREGALQCKNNEL